MKTFDKKDIFTCVTADEAITYIGNNGYFANSLSGFNHIDCFAPYSLDEVQIGTDKPFVYKKESYALFLPANKIKEVEEPKKYRPFKSIDEFKKETGLDLLSIVHYRYITEKPKIITTIGFGVITDFNTCNDENYYITIGDISFNLDELFNYEYLSNNEWQPFGVEE